MNTTERVALAIKDAERQLKIFILPNIRKSIAEATIAAYRDALKDEGMVIVPREPSDRMLMAGEDGRKAASRASGIGGQTVEASMAHHHRYEFRIYRAMIEAGEADAPEA